MEKEKTKNGWGGKRAGSGRPRTTTIQRVYSIRTNDELAEFIESHENKSEFIKGCVIKEMNGLYAGATTPPATQTSADDAQEDTIERNADVVSNDSANVESVAPEIHHSSSNAFNDFDYSILGEVCTGSDVKSINMPYYDTKEDSSNFPMSNDSKVESQDVDFLRMLCPHLESSSLIKVKGDSMTDADIYDGDIIIVDKSNRNPTDRELAVCELNGEYTIKYVRVRDKRGILVPANRDYPEWRITPDENFNVWGTVTFVIHKPRNL